jgi:aldose 1-epimerase
VITFSAGGATATLDPSNGGRISSLRVREVELLVTEGENEVRWGIFPMAPFAGRIGHGRFTFEGVNRVLSPRLEGHAIHGTAIDGAWEQIGSGSIRTALSDPWPYAGAVEHSVELDDDCLRATLRVRAEERMPVTVGWHPWFRRKLEQGAAANIALVADAMYERQEKLPTGNVVDPKPPPWDDCFTGVQWPVTVRWPGFGTLEVSSDCTHVVVYDEERDAVCVEPQSGPPDAVNIGGAAVLEPGDDLVATMQLRWALEG